ncbi:hypothetical protein [Actinotalea fermentans]|uniref:Uncharacterized protein n=1 Tax=Actinotalea fermentans TaxID=43671 RepID=A0A511Z1B9_9CELL|nr:hypothetical protein [Actinotalea fermentans]GEN81255.1 hypothetical protein AFE02nite_29890 [Actinotalea fermentans]
MNPKKTVNRRRRLVAGGMIAASLSLAGAGAAIAAGRGAADDVPDPALAGDPVAQEPVEDAAAAAAYDAFWAAGYTSDDLVALAALWQLDQAETKVAAGQLLLAGEELPIAPGSSPVTETDSDGTDWSTLPDGYTREQYEAFWGAGYTADDLAALVALWNTDEIQTKATAGQMILDGQTVPVAPGSTTAAS